MNKRKFVILNIVIILLFIIFFIFLYFSLNLILKDFTDISLYSAKSSKLPWHELLLYFINFVILPLSVLIMELYIIFHIKNQYISYTIFWFCVDLLLTYFLFKVTPFAILIPFVFCVIKCSFRIIKRNIVLKTN